MVGEYSCPLMAEQWEVTLWSKFTDSHYHLQDCSPRLFDSFCMRLEIPGLFCEGERLNSAAGRTLTSANGIPPSLPVKRKKIYFICFNYPFNLHALVSFQDSVEVSTAHCSNLWSLHFLWSFVSSAVTASGKCEVREARQGEKNIATTVDNSLAQRKYIKSFQTSVN